MTHTLLVRDFLEVTAARLPEKVALVCEGWRWTYGELDDTANRLAQLLMANGVSRGDRVAICLPNSTEAVIAIFAALKAGAVFVPLNHATRRDKLAYVLNNCEARAFVTDTKHATVRELAPSLQCVVSADNDETAGTIAFARAQTFTGVCPPRQNIDVDLACLIYTSGSTGEPKGVMSDHSNVAFVSASIIEYLGNREDDVVLNVLPLSFDYGLYQLLMTFRFGGTLVLENSFAYPATILQRIEQERVTGLPGVPTILAMLLKMDLRAFACHRCVTSQTPPRHCRRRTSRNCGALCRTFACSRCMG
jgi:long-chain acyl-CoA synthetase